MSEYLQRDSLRLQKGRSPDALDLGTFSSYEVLFKSATTQVQISATLACDYLWNGSSVCPRAQSWAGFEHHIPS